MKKILLLLLFILIGCSSEPYEIEYPWIGGGGLFVGEEIKTEGLYREIGTKWGDIEHGPYVEYYPNGDREEGTYRFGTKKGRYVYYISKGGWIVEGVSKKCGKYSKNDGMQRWYDWRKELVYEVFYEDCKKVYDRTVKEGQFLYVSREYYKKYGTFKEKK